MDKIQLSILGISYNQTKSGAYALILSEIEGKRRIPIIIGATEAQAIAIHLEDLKPPRPLTHDLFVNFSEAFEIKLEEIFIYKMNNGIFHSEILYTRGKNRIRLDARTSDAVALAIREDAPIYIASTVLEDAGLEIDIDDGEFSIEKDVTIRSVDDLKISDLTDEQLLGAQNAAIGDENYELAGVLKAEIDKRKKAK